MRLDLSVSSALVFATFLWSLSSVVSGAHTLLSLESIPTNTNSFPNRPPKMPKEKTTRGKGKGKADTGKKKKGKKGKPAILLILWSRY